ncbi:MAG: hypothetical protein R2747_15995 [Pyrinomonadaceae bacterium]
MVSSNAGKIFLPLSLMLAIVFSCSWWQDRSGNSSVPKPSGDLVSRVPFETKEPQVFEADFVTTSYVSGSPSERRVRAARNGIKLRYDYPDGLIFLQLSETESFLLDDKKKIYARTPNGSGQAEGGGLRDFLTTEWLSEKRDAGFEKLGAADDGLIKYRVMPDGAAAGSEIYVYFDEVNKIPVKQEFYSVLGEQKTLVSAMEVRNLKLAAADSLFVVPNNFREVPLKEFQTEIRR